MEAGWHVEGLTLWLMSGKGACCAEGLVDAAGICEQLGIQHHVVDTRETFQQEIVERLVNGYRDGVSAALLAMQPFGEIRADGELGQGRTSARSDRHWALRQDTTRWRERQASTAARSGSQQGSELFPL